MTSDATHVGRIPGRRRGSSASGGTAQITTLTRRSLHGVAYQAKGMSRPGDRWIRVSTTSSSRCSVDTSVRR